MVSFIDRLLHKVQAYGTRVLTVRAQVLLHL